MANYYGTRYLKTDEFIKYCQSLNIETDKRELEYYEKSGIMLPLIRITYPEDYIRLLTFWLHGKGQVDNPPNMDQWEGLAKIFDKNRVLLKDYADLTDAELVDSFDREIDDSPFLSRPSVDNYKPWREHEIEIELEGYKTSGKVLEQYYSYWQVYQLKNVQRYPDLWKNKPLLDLIPPEKKEKNFHPWVPNFEKLLDFNGMAKMFDILSFWINMYHREELKTFSQIPERHQTKRLDDSQLQSYQNQITVNAKSVQTKFSITSDDLYSFLYELINLRGDYLKDEKIKLADELRNDIIYLSYFIQAITGIEWDDVADELGKRNYPYWIKKNFRQLNVSTKEYDEVSDLLESYIKNYEKELIDAGITNPTWQFSRNELEEFLDYCSNEGPSLFITATSGMISSEEEYAKKFRRVSKYTNLKNIATSLEYLLHSFIEKGNLTFKGLGLKSKIEITMKSRVNWFPLYEEKRKSFNTNNTTDFYNKIVDLMNDPVLLASENSYWARIFLVSYLARNLTVHEHPNDDWFYGELFGEMLRSTIYAMLYSWKLAKKEKWI